ncbi:MarR family winged helix-turn-helix transcriptional regulator [Streptomyces sp. 4N509B]|uniref:MarR family winged helix-turn-helix transcriptional regulator n=1 Tax=Streptomyces sp. 4N509B TaxID=3457413 RepID=UPI003FD622D9
MEPNEERRWGTPIGATRQEDLELYFRGIASARYAVRRVFRIVDDQARRVGLEPLQHQALIQVFGAGGAPLRVNDVSERLDIAPAFASRLVRDLESKQLVTREASTEDRRITLVRITDAGRELLSRIDRDVHAHVAYFQSQLADEERMAALSICAFYVGVPFEAEEITAMEKLVRSALERRSA